MLTYLSDDNILFSCDLFGSHLATSDLYASNQEHIHELAKRYYAEIMMPFRTTIQKNIDKLNDYTIDIIAPSHGPLYDNPEFIMSAYRDWILDQPKNIVVLPYVSMHDSTRKMVEFFVETLVKKGITVQQFDLTAADIGKLAMSLVDAATIVLGTPTVLAGLHPNVAYAAFLANCLRPKLKFAAVIGSYGWGGKAIEQLTTLIPNLKVEMLSTVLCKGIPRETDFADLENLAELIAQKHQENNIV
jgi:flavorubredoxin